MSSLSTLWNVRFSNGWAPPLGPTHVHSAVFFGLETFPAPSFVFKLCSVNEGCSDGCGERSSGKMMPRGYVRMLPAISNKQSREELASNQQGDRNTTMAKMPVLIIWLISVFPADSRQCSVGNNDCHPLFTHHAGSI